MTTISLSRVNSHLAAPLVVPETAEDRAKQYSRTLAVAVAFLESRITSGDVAAAERAVAMLFDLEKTRLRHARPVHGVPEPTPPKKEVTMLPPIHDEIAPRAKSEVAESLPTPSPAVVPEHESPEEFDLFLDDADADESISAMTVLKRRLSEAFPGRVWSEAELARMLAELTVLHREQCEQKSSSPKSSSVSVNLNRPDGR